MGAGGASGSLRTYRGKLIPTPLGRRMLAAEQHGPLQAVLFHVAFWHLNLAYFDRYALDFLASDPTAASSCGRFRRRHTIGCRERHSRGFAPLPSSTFWNGNGISAPVPWRPAFSDHCSGSGSWNHEPNRDRQPTWSSVVYTERHRCLIVL